MLRLILVELILGGLLGLLLSAFYIAEGVARLKRWWLSQRFKR